MLLLALPLVPLVWTPPLGLMLTLKLVVLMLMLMLMLMLILALKLAAMAVVVPAARVKEDHHIELVRSLLFSGSNLRFLCAGWWVTLPTCHTLQTCHTLPLFAFVTTVLTAPSSQPGVASFDCKLEFLSRCYCYGNPHL
jgi:hypothetical protein